MRFYRLWFLSTILVLNAKSYSEMRSEMGIPVELNDTLQLIRLKLDGHAKWIHQFDSLCSQIGGTAGNCSLMQEKVSKVLNYEEKCLKVTPMQKSNWLPGWFQISGNASRPNFAWNIASLEEISRLLCKDATLKNKTTNLLVKKGCMENTLKQLKSTLLNILSIPLCDSSKSEAGRNRFSVEVKVATGKPHLLALYLLESESMDTAVSKFCHQALLGFESCATLRMHIQRYATYEHGTESKNGTADFSVRVHSNIPIEENPISKKSIIPKLKTELVTPDADSAIFGRTTSKAVKEKKSPIHPHKYGILLFSTSAWLLWTVFLMGAFYISFTLKRHQFTQCSMAVQLKRRKSAISNLKALSRQYFANTMNAWQRKNVQSRKYIGAQKLIRQFNRAFLKMALKKWAFYLNRNLTISKLKEYFRGFTKQKSHKEIASFVHQFVRDNFDICVLNVEYKRKAAILLLQSYKGPCYRKAFYQWKVLSVQEKLSNQHFLNLKQNVLQRMVEIDTEDAARDATILLSKIKSYRVKHAWSRGKKN